MRLGRALFNPRAVLCASASADVRSAEWVGGRPDRRTHAAVPCQSTTTDRATAPVMAAAVRLLGPLSLPSTVPFHVLPCSKVGGGPPDVEEETAQEPKLQGVPKGCGGSAVPREQGGGRLQLRRGGSEAEEGGTYFF